MAGAEAYLRAKFHLDPSKRLATIHQRHRQTGQDNGPIIRRTVLQTLAQKRFALSYRTVVCLSCPVCDVNVLCPNGWMDQDATWYTEIGLGPGHIVLDGDPAPP